MVARLKGVKLVVARRAPNNIAPEKKLKVACISRGLSIILTYARCSTDRARAVVDYCSARGGHTAWFAQKKRRLSSILEDGERSPTLSDVPIVPTAVFARFVLFCRHVVSGM